MNEFEERAYEVERGRIVSGKLVFSQDHLNQDEPAWFESRTGRGLKSLEDLTLPIGWRWSSNWKISLTDGNTDSEGWVPDGKDYKLRRRKWIRKREKINAQSSLSSRSNSSVLQTPLQFTGQNDENTLVRVIQEAMQRLDSCIQRLTVASEKSTVDRITSEAKEAIADSKSALLSLERIEKPTVRAARLKLSKDLEQYERHFDLMFKEAYSRSSRPVVNQRKTNSDVRNVASASVAAREEEERETQRLAEQRKQQEQIQKLEREHKQILTNEIQSNARIIKDRHEGLLEVNKNAHILQDMMVKLANLTEEQGETIRTVVKSTEVSKENVEKGLKEVERSEQYQQEGSCLIS